MLGFNEPPKPEYSIQQKDCPDRISDPRGGETLFKQGRKSKYASHRDIKNNHE